MIEFRLIKDQEEWIPPSQDELDRYRQMVDDDYYGLALFPQGHSNTISVIVEMTEMVNDGWNVHTIGETWALMEREVDDEN